MLVSSADGQAWRVRSVIAGPDCPFEGQEGPCESALCRLKDNRLMCVFRLSSFVPYGQCWSDDDGRTWTAPVAMPAHSVEPSLQVMGDGTVALSGGRNGVYRDGLRADGKPIVLEKEFWQNAEVLVGFLDGYEEFREPRYLDAFEQVWRFVRDRMVIAGAGEWRTLLDREGHPLDANIGNPWKVRYHTGRAMLECTGRLGRLTSPEYGLVPNGGAFAHCALVYGSCF